MTFVYSFWFESSFTQESRSRTLRRASGDYAVGNWKLETCPGIALLHIWIEGGNRTAGVGSVLVRCENLTIWHPVSRCSILIIMSLLRCLGKKLVRNTWKLARQHFLYLSLTVHPTPRPLSARTLVSSRFASSRIAAVTSFPSLLEN